jgi:predicted transcriptional regulator
MAETEKLTLVATVAANYLRRNPVGVDQIGTVFAAVTRALEDAARRLEGGAAPEERADAAPAERPEPAVSIRRSVRPDHLVCLECGHSAKTLKRHLQAVHEMTPQQYREKWALKPDYPMTAPTYSERRSQMAKARGFGRRPGAAQAGRRKTRKRQEDTAKNGGRQAGE